MTQHELKVSLTTNTSYTDPDSRSKATQATPTIFQVVGRHCAPRLAHSKTDLRADALMQLKQGLWHNLTS